MWLALTSIVLATAIGFDVLAVAARHVRRAKDDEPSPPVRRSRRKRSAGGMPVA
jgi:hypothetical protein